MKFYTRGFRRSVLSVLMHNRIFYEILSPKSIENLFESDLNIIYKAIRQFYKEHKQANKVQWQVLEAIIYDLLSEEPASFKEAVVTEAKRIYDMNLVDSNEQKNIVKKALDWLLRNRILSNISTIISLVEEGKDISLVKRKLDELFSVNYESLEYFDISQMDNLPEIINEMRNKNYLVSWGFPTLDFVTLGGMNRGEVFIVLGGAKSGKTTFVCEIGKNALKQNLNVVHISLELDEAMVAWKYATSITGLSYSEISRNADEYKKRYQKFKEKYKGKLFIKKFPMKSTDAYSIKSFIQSLYVDKKLDDNEKIGLIIIDYDDLLIPSKDRGNTYENIGQIYEDLFALARYFECPILTPAQTNRQGWLKSMNGETITSHELAHGAIKKHHCSGIFVLNPLKTGELMIVADTIRLGRQGVKVTFFYDLSRNMYFEQLDANTGVKVYEDVFDEYIADIAKEAEVQGKILPKQVVYKYYSVEEDKILDKSKKEIILVDEEEGNIEPSDNPDDYDFGDEPEETKSQQTEQKNNTNDDYLDFV